MRQNKLSPMDRIIRRALTNGIKSITGLGDRVKPAEGISKLVTYTSHRETFLVLLQADAAQLDHSFDQGRRAEEFAALVARVHEQMQAEAGAP